MTPTKHEQVFSDSLRVLRHRVSVGSMRDGAANSDPSSDPVVAWRAERLRGAGFSAGLARRVACQPAYDLHALLELIDRGCPAELAARILAPVDEATGRC